MERILIEELLKWKEKSDRKPLILRGARQVGKTWLLKDFGKRCFENVCYVNFEQKDVLGAIFDGTLSPQRIIEQLSVFSGQRIRPNSTLVIFDEVQEVPRALTSLKYFAEEAPEYAICCAGSLLGVALHEGTSFPVGKVEFLDLYPLSFREFLLAKKKCRCEKSDSCQQLPHGNALLHPRKNFRCDIELRQIQRHFDGRDHNAKERHSPALLPSGPHHKADILPDAVLRFFSVFHVVSPHAHSIAEKNRPRLIPGTNRFFRGMNCSSHSCGSSISVVNAPSSLLRLMYPSSRSTMASMRTRPKPCPSPLVLWNSPPSFCIFFPAVKLVKEM